MKKLIVLFAAAILALPFLCACDPEDNPTKNVVMEPASTAEYAVLFTFEDKPLYILNGQKFEIRTIEFTEDSRYILGLTPVTISATKAIRVESIVSGIFTVNGGKYITKGEYEAQIELGDKMATITGASNGDFKGNRKKSVSSTVEQVNAHRTWVVDNTYIKITGGLNVEAAFKGCDFQEIAQFLKDANVKIDPSKLAGYKISEMQLTGSDTMNIVYSPTLSFYGSYTLSGENFSYSLMVIHNNDIMGAVASGKLTFPADKRAELIINTSISGYNGTIQFSLSQARN
ncbi:MAG: hypothetical protein J5702_06225 [Bacteroidales bacterium]|nr:hypothetical protein [Bacteroidales bacterium]